MSDRTDLGISSLARDPVSKAFGLLTYFVDSDERAWTARELAARLNAPVSSIHRTLLALVRAGVLTRSEDSSAFEFSSDLHRISRRVVSRFPLPELAQEHLHHISDVTGETSLFGLLDGASHRMSFVAQAEGVHPLRYVVPLNTWVSLTQGASGLAILAFLTPESRAEVLDKHRESDDGISQAELTEAISKTRSRGYAISHGQRISGATGIAAPVFDPIGNVIGDLVLTIPRTRFVETDETALARLITERAAWLTRTVGGSTPSWKEASNAT